MTHERGEDLGHGVHVSPGLSAEFIVTSPRLDLGWREAHGQVSGTAVSWGECAFEVVGRSGAGSGDQWTLRRWDEESVMRGVFTLDRESVAEIADRAAAESRDARTRRSTVLLLPLLGLAPAGLQKRWADDWGLNAERATQISAVCELLVGSLGIIQVAASAFGGENFIPTWLAFPGVFLFASGFVRLALVAADGEPVGSVLGLVWLPMKPKSTPTTPDTKPAVRSFDQDVGRLVLVSPIHRRDWDREGLLPFRGDYFRLEAVEMEGRTWIYLFSRENHGDGADRVIRLVPPSQQSLSSPAVDPDAPSFPRTMLVTAAVTLGPASDQERWSTGLGVRAVWLTVLGAVAEFVGGIANLQRDFGSPHQVLILLDIFLVGEGLLRLGSAFIGRPMGSVFGWILRPLYRRWLP